MLMSFWAFPSLFAVYVVVALAVLLSWFSIIFLCCYRLVHLLPFTDVGAVAAVTAFVAVVALVNVVDAITAAAPAFVIDAVTIIDAITNLLLSLLLMLSLLLLLPLY
jgi:hypothetical protein